MVNASLQLWLLKREIHGLEGGRILSTLVRVIVAAVAMAAAAWAANDVMTSVLPGQGLAIQIVRLAASIGGALATLAGMAQLLRIPEFTDARDLILGRLRRMAG